MLAVIVLIFCGFALLIANSYRAARAHSSEGKPFRPEGKLRWP